LDISAYTISYTIDTLKENQAVHIDLDDKNFRIGQSFVMPLKEMKDDLNFLFLNGLFIPSHKKN
jgi:hypothetical protein